MTWSRIVPQQHRIAGLERVEDRALRDRAVDVELHFAVDVRQGSQMIREDDADHGSVCTSTDSTAGRSRTIGVQLSPPSGETVDLAAGGAEVDAARIERVDGHRVAQDVDVAVSLRQAFGERLPLVAAGAAAVDAELAFGRIVLASRS